MIPYGKHFIDEDDIQSVVNILRHGPLTQGPAIDIFEKTVAEYVGAKYAVAVSSGTAALHLAYLAAGVAYGNSVVTSPITFVATANAAKYCGGDVIFVDINPDTVNMCSAALVDVLSKNKNVRVVAPVHFAGLPCDMVSIKEAADSIGADVIEDAAHALGAVYPSGKRVGSCENSLMTTFSFHPVKAIAAGEGGLITTNDELIYRKLLRLRSHGINKGDDPFLLGNQSETNGLINPWYYEMQELGFHYRITDIQCALATSQFKKLDKFIERRRTLVRQYDEAFEGNDVLTPVQSKFRQSSAHHLYILRINYPLIGVTRAQFITKLRSVGIIPQVHYMPVVLHPYYHKLGYDEKCIPNAMKYYDEALSIPLYYQLSDREQKTVIDTLFLNR